MSYSPLIPDDEKRILLRLTLRIIFIVLVSLFAWYIVPPLFSLFAPFFFALIAAAILNPTIRLLQHKLGWGRSAFALLVLVVLLGLIGSGLFLLVYMAGKQLIELMSNWEYILEWVQNSLQATEALFDQFWSLVPPALSDMVDSIYINLINWLKEAIPAILEDFASRGGAFATAVPSFLLALLMFLLATYFCAADYPYIRTRALSHLSDDFLDFLGQVRTTALSAFGGYIKAQILLSVGVFFILLTGFILIGLEYSILLALMLSVLDFIPIIGSGTIMVPWAFISVFSGDYRTTMELMVIWGIIVIFRRVAEAKFVGDQTGLSPIVSLMSIYVGMRVAGILGMILGPIITLVVLNLIGLGIFRGLQDDLYPTIAIISRIFKERPHS